MSDNIYGFNEQHRIGARGEAVLDAFFAQRYTIRPASPEQQRLGIDRIFHKRNGETSRVEYKTDYTAARTGNAFIETVSRDVPPPRSGWVWTSTADRIVYYVPGLNEAYLLNPQDLSMHVNAFVTNYPVKVVPNPTYNTYGVLVPLMVLRELAIRVYAISGEEASAA